MKEQLITEITRNMLPYLDNSQMEQLQEVYRCTDKLGTLIGMDYSRSQCQRPLPE